MQTKTCKDCLCYAACGYHITEETDMTVNECSTGFKDKEEYVRLPVYIGQKLWLVQQYYYNKQYAIIAGTVSMIQQKADKSWKFRFSMRGSGKDFTIDQIGQQLFYTREEAEEGVRNNG